MRQRKTQYLGFNPLARTLQDDYADLVEKTRRVVSEEIAEALEAAGMPEAATIARSAGAVQDE